MVHGVIHKTGSLFSYSENFIDPKTGAQTIETPWRHIKNKNMRSD